MDVHSTEEIYDRADVMIETGIMPTRTIGIATSDDTQTKHDERIGSDSNANAFYHNRAREASVIVISSAGRRRATSRSAECDDDYVHHNTTTTKPPQSMATETATVQYNIHQRRNQSMTDVQNNGARGVACQGRALPRGGSDLGSSLVHVS